MPYCSSCGKNVVEMARFCRNCGYDLPAEISVPGVPAVRTVDETEEAPLVQPDTARSRTLDTVPWWLGWLAFSTLLAYLGLCMTWWSLAYPFLNDNRLDDIPWWLHLLAVPVTLTFFIGFPVYCVWAYRRGRRDGIDREPSEQPYRYFGWRVIGWSLVSCLWFMVLYVWVHLPTLCYKNGLSVGANDATATLRFTSLPAIMVPFARLAVPAAVALMGGAIGEFSTQGGGASDKTVAERTPTPPRRTPTGPRLTGAEAAGKAEAALRAMYTQDQLSENGVTLSASCDYEDYNGSTRDWIVRCTMTWGSIRTGNTIRVDSVRYKVNDRNGRSSPVE